jgi:hypothetical protein
MELDGVVCTQGLESIDADVSNVEHCWAWHLPHYMRYLDARLYPIILDVCDSRAAKRTLRTSVGVLTEADFP